MISEIRLCLNGMLMALTPELTERGDTAIKAKSSDKGNAIRAPVE